MARPLMRSAGRDSGDLAGPGPGFPGRIPGHVDAYFVAVVCRFHDRGRRGGRASVGPALTGTSARRPQSIRPSTASTLWRRPSGVASRMMPSGMPKAGRLLVSSAPAHRADAGHPAPTAHPEPAVARRRLGGVTPTPCGRTAAAKSPSAEAAVGDSANRPPRNPVVGPGSVHLPCARTRCVSGNPKRLKYTSSISRCGR